MALALAWPLGAILLAFAAGATAAHQLQVRALVEPAHLARPGSALDAGARPGSGGPGGRVPAGRR